MPARSTPRLRRLPPIGCGRGSSPGIHRRPGYPRRRVPTSPPQASFRRHRVLALSVPVSTVVVLVGERYPWAMRGRFSFTESLFRRVFHQGFVPHLEVGLHFGAERESVAEKKGGRPGEGQWCLYILLAIGAQEAHAGAHAHGAVIARCLRNPPGSGRDCYAQL